ncbi:MAG: GcrA family cell cycle regulator [Martelella sp.]|uniref:GcrA family cell cycle regulator n=1 Tax=Martelella sp. TaxID=1969699 RepID=UPI003242B086
MSWTDERVEKLKQLWSEGLSASQIATQLGGVSRNAVIGKVHRLSLPGRAKSGGAPPQAAPRATARNTAPPRAPNFASRVAGRRPTAPPQSTPSAPRTAGATALKQEVEADISPVARPRSNPDNVVPIMKKVALTELTEMTCKWPVGDPTQDDFYFCGCDAKDNSPYCSYHAKLAYQPVSDRRRAG